MDKHRFRMVPPLVRLCRHTMNALGPSLAPYVRSSRSLKKLVTPVAHWYADLMGYRRMGLKYDDLRASFIFVAVLPLTFFLSKNRNGRVA